jgi:hypothetical protein
MADLDNMDPAMGGQDDAEHHHLELSPEEKEQQGKMAKADLYKLASYSKKLFEQLHDDDQLESWVQAKVTKAADYIASVYHYLEYEMKFNDYSKHLSDAETMHTLSEGQRAQLVNMLNEAKDKMKELKKTQAEKMKMESTCSGCHKPAKKCTCDDMKEGKEHKDKDSFDDSASEGDTYTTKSGNKVTKTKQGRKHEKQFPDSYKGHGAGSDKDLDEGMTEPCSHCGGQGHVAKAHPRDRAHPTVVAKAEAYHTKMKATQAAIRRMNKSSEDELIPEGNMPMKKVNGKSVPAFAADGKGKNDLAKKKLKENMSPAELAHHHASEYAKHHKAGNIDLMKHHKDECQKCGGKISHGAMGECYHSHPAIQGGQMYECNPSMMPAPMAEGKPSAGLSKEKKSAVVKKAKAGGDIGKPGKSFDKLAKSAGGGEKGKKIAAAAMWKNIKETTAYIEEKKAVEKKDKPMKGDKIADEGNAFGDAVRKAKADGIQKGETIKVGGNTYPVKESTEVDRMRELTGRLNRSEKPALVENREVDQIRALTQRLLG